MEVEGQERMVGQHPRLRKGASARCSTFSTHDRRCPCAAVIAIRREYKLPVVVFHIQVGVWHRCTRSEEQCWEERGTHCGRKFRTPRSTSRRLPDCRRRGMYLVICHSDRCGPSRCRNSKVPRAFGPGDARGRGDLRMTRTMGRSRPECGQGGRQ